MSSLPKPFRVSAPPRPNMRSGPPVPSSVSAFLVPKHWTPAWQIMVAASAIPLESRTAAISAVNSSVTFFIFFTSLLCSSFARVRVSVCLLPYLITPFSGRHLLREFHHLHLGGGIFDEETLSLYGEPHPAIAAGVSFGHEAEGSPETFGVDRHVEAGGSALYLYGHLDLLLASSRGSFS